MIKVAGDRTLYVDCDDTLVMWDLSAYPDLPRTIIDCFEPTIVVLNQKNVNLVNKFHKLGYRVIIWSQTGAEWAEAVAKATGLDVIADLCISKPTYYLDDLPASAWADLRVWREPT